MRVIICNVQLFSNDQNVQVYDTSEGRIIYNQKVDMQDLVPAICTVAKQFDLTEVRLSGVGQYALPYVNEIKNAYALNYNYNILNVEVI